MPILSRGPAQHAAPSTYTMAAGEALEPEAVTATFDGSGAAGSFLPTLSVYAQSGELIARSPATEVAAGSSAEVTFAPLLRAASAAAAGGDFSNIFSTTLAAEGPFTVAGIPQTFRHLLIVVTGRINDPNGDVYAVFNGDLNGGHYPTMLFEAQSAFSAGSDFVTGGLFLGYFPATGYPAGSVGTYAFWIPNYTGTVFNKQAFDTGGFPGGSPMELDVAIGQWLSTAAITSIVVTHNPSGGGAPPDFIAGSTIDVYGLG